MREIRKERLAASASFTVEAAIIVPLIISIIFAILTLIFCLYYRIRLESEIDIELFSAFERRFEGEGKKHGLSYKSEKAKHRNLMGAAFGEVRNTEKAILSLDVKGELALNERSVIRNAIRDGETIADIIKRLIE